MPRSERFLIIYLYAFENLLRDCQVRRWRDRTEHWSGHLHSFWSHRRSSSSGNVLQTFTLSFPVANHGLGVYCLTPKAHRRILILVAPLPKLARDCSHFLLVVLFNTAPLCQMRSIHFLPEKDAIELFDQLGRSVPSRLTLP